MEQKELEKENERLTMEARNLRRAINAFKEYDEERKKYIEGLERELEETRGKLAEARSTIEKSKDADYVKRCRKGNQALQHEEADRCSLRTLPLSRRCCAVIPMAAALKTTRD